MTPLPSGRLHRWSWVFFAARALRELALPLIIVLVLRRDGDLATLLVSAAGGVFIIGYGIAKSLSFRFEILADEVVIREGVLVRELRHVPMTRIQSVSERRGPLHRLLGVTELVLESGSGGKPEAVMQVLDPLTAAEISNLLQQARQRRTESASADAFPVQSNSAAARTLLTLPTSELIRAGIISNRGFVVVGLIGGVFAQNADLLERLPWIEEFLRLFGLGLSDATQATPWQLLVGVTTLILISFVLLRVLSVAHAIFALHGYILERSGDRVRVRRGLLTRVDVSGRISTIQRLTLERTLLHRLFDRCSLRVDVASQSMENVGIAPQLGYLAPIATVAQAQALLQECESKLDLEALEWQPLHGSAALRRWQQSLWWLLPLCAVALMIGLANDVLPGNGLWWTLGTTGGALLASAWHARRWANWAAFATFADIFIWRSGVWRQRWVIVFAARAQAACLTRSPRDRREDTTGLTLDSQGTLTSRTLRIPYLARGDALALKAKFWSSNQPRQCRSDSDDATLGSASSQAM